MNESYVWGDAIHCGLRVITDTALESLRELPEVIAAAERADGVHVLMAIEDDDQWRRITQDAKMGYRLQGAVESRTPSVEIQKTRKSNILGDYVITVECTYGGDARINGKVIYAYDGRQNPIGFVVAKEVLDAAGIEYEEEWEGVEEEYNDE